MVGNLTATDWEMYDGLDPQGAPKWWQYRSSTEMRNEQAIFKFRGFITRDREQKKSLYSEALRFNPANENVRTLLKDLENPPEED